MPSSVTHKTTFSRIMVRALVGPRPVYSANSRTTCLLTAAVSEPGVRSCVSVLDTPASALDPLYVQAARKGEGKDENPTNDFRHREAYRQFRSVSALVGTSRCCFEARVSHISPA